jgi:sulfatase modifying factor 1
MLNKPKLSLFCGFCSVLTVSIANSIASDSVVRIDKTEVSIGAFSEFVEATGFLTQAEKQGGMVYEAGWSVKPGWSWRQPYGVDGEPDEPAAFITFDEAEAYCEWVGKRLPSRQEWINAAYKEQRPAPPAPFMHGTTYQYPTGETPMGANCLRECGAAASLEKKKRDYSDVLSRGFGHAPVGVTAPGVNGLFDMGANLWEWAKIDDKAEHQATMGGSWWYGARQMTADYGATKPRGMAAIYIGFRCISD